VEITGSEGVDPADPEAGSPAFFAFVLARKPPSYNSKGKGKQGWEVEVGALVEGRRSGPLLSGLLYARVIWFHRDKKRGQDGDADNASKPILDALKGILYDDDIQIVQRLVQKIHTSEKYELDQPPTHADVTEELYQLLEDDHPHIIYVEVGRVRLPPRVAFGPIDGG
jgi:Holliday junction resolvase RusA-like endonuclease